MKRGRGVAVGEKGDVYSVSSGNGYEGISEWMMMS